MHNSSYQHMQRLVSTYLTPGSTLEVVDIGSFDVNGSYRTLFAQPGGATPASTSRPVPAWTWCWRRPTGCRSPRDRWT